MSAALTRRYPCPVCRRSITPRPDTAIVSAHRDGAGAICPMSGEPLPPDDLGSGDVRTSPTRAAIRAAAPGRVGDPVRRMGAGVAAT